MPLPKPRKNEKKDEFLSRCMSDDSMTTEFSDSAQRYAVCNTQWSSSKKEKEDEEEKAHHMKKPKKKDKGKKKKPGCKKDAADVAAKAEATAEEIKRRHEK